MDDINIFTKSKKNEPENLIQTIKYTARIEESYLSSKNAHKEKWTKRNGETNKTAKLEKPKSALRK